MTDQTPGSSGNRWEPTDQPTSQPSGQPGEQPLGQPTGPGPEYAEPVARAPWLTRTRKVVAAGAAAVLLAGGIGGFALGRAAAGGDDQDPLNRQSDQRGGPAGFDRDRDGDGRVFPDRGTGQMPGQLPGDDQRELDGNDTQDS